MDREKALAYVRQWQKDLPGGSKKLKATAYAKRVAAGYAILQNRDMYTDFLPFSVSRRNARLVVYRGMSLTRAQVKALKVTGLLPTSEHVISSWSTSIDGASQFAYTSHRNNSYGIIVVTKLKPSDIIADLSMVESYWKSSGDVSYHKGSGAGENEVLAVSTAYSRKFSLDEWMLIPDYKG